MKLLTTNLITSLLAATLVLGCSRPQQEPTTQTTQPQQQTGEKASQPRGDMHRYAPKDPAPPPRLPPPPRDPQADSDPLTQALPAEMDLTSLPASRQAEVIMRSWAFLLAAWRLETGRYPTTAEGLAVLAEGSPQTAESWQERPSPQLLVDPWGSPYRYEYTGDDKEPFAIRSLGPDGVESDDDLACQEVDDAHAVVLVLLSESAP